MSCATPLLATVGIARCGPLSKQIVCNRSRESAAGLCRIFIPTETAQEKILRGREHYSSRRWVWQYAGD